MTMSEYMEKMIVDFEKELIELLDYEIKINEKKIKGIPLTEKEFIFDTYFIKPSTVAKSILERDKDNYDK